MCIHKAWEVNWQASYAFLNINRCLILKLLRQKEQDWLMVEILTKASVSIIDGNKARI